MARAILIGLIGVGLAEAAGPAAASMITVIAETNFIGQSTGVYDIKGLGITRGIGDNISVSYTDVNGKAATTPLVELKNQGGSGAATVSVAAKAGTTITFTNTNEDGPGTIQTITAAANFNPPGQQVITPLVVAVGSATLGGSTFVLSGGFTTVATNVDLDPTSPTYGNLSGIFPAAAFQILGTGAGGSFALSLAGDQPWTINEASIWGVDVFNGVSVPFSTPLSGNLTTDAGSTPFAGAATGNVTFFPDGSETIDADFTFQTSLGPVTGSLTASGIASPTPEPSSLVTAGIGAALGLGWTCCRKAARGRSI